MDSNNTETTTEHILVEFLVKHLKKVSRFQILGQTIVGDFMVSNDTEYTTDRLNQPEFEV